MAKQKIEQNTMDAALERLQKAQKDYESFKTFENLREKRKAERIIAALSSGKPVEVEE